MSKTGFGILKIVLLRELKRDGLLDGYTLQQIADALPGNEHRSTISRNLRVIEFIDLNIGLARAEFLQKLESNLKTKRQPQYTKKQRGNIKPRQSRKD